MDIVRVRSRNCSVWLHFGTNRYGLREKMGEFSLMLERFGVAIWGLQASLGPFHASPELLESLLGVSMDGSNLDITDFL